MDIKEVKELLEQFDRSSLTEFDLHEGSFELYMNKNQTSRQTAPVVESKPVSLDQPKEAAATPAQETAALVKQEGGQIISSPIVGVVYLQPSPDQPVFKEAGDSVKKGETVCIIEAMKLLNEVVSDFDGTVAEVLVKNEDVVEYGQPLFRIN